MPNPKKKTEPGAVDDDAMERAKSNTKKKKDMLRDLFDDNTTNRYSKESVDS